MMKQSTWVGGVVVTAIVGTGVLSAQSGSSTSQSQQGTMKVTGCVQRADQMSGSSSTAGSGGTSGGASGSDRFVLTSASMGSSSGTSGSATSGTSGSGSSAGTGTTYALSGKTSDLREHLNHQVEVTGKLSSKSSSSTSGAAGGGTSGSGTSGSSGTPAGTIDVDSVRMIAATCPSR